MRNLPGSELQRSCHCGTCMSVATRKQTHTKVVTVYLSSLSLFLILSTLLCLSYGSYALECAKSDCWIIFTRLSRMSVFTCVSGFHICLFPICVNISDYNTSYFWPHSRTQAFFFIEIPAHRRWKNSTVGMRKVRMHMFAVIWMNGGLQKVNSRRNVPFNLSLHDS